MVHSSSDGKKYLYSDDYKSCRQITHNKLGVFRLLSFLDFCSRNKLLYRKKSMKKKQTVVH